MGINSLSVRKKIKARGSEVQLQPSTTGAENTGRGLEALIDWFQFTLPFQSPDEAMDFLRIPKEDWEEKPKGALGYKGKMICGNIELYYDGGPNMGIHIRMSGQGCRQYEGRFGNVWPVLIKAVFDVGGHFSRLDAALDDYKGYFSIKQLERKVRKAEVRTVFGRNLKKDSNTRGGRGARLIEHICPHTGESGGKTLYFGSGKSDIIIKFYDKAKKEGIRGIWNRTEIECRNKRADFIASHILNRQDIGAVIAGVLVNYLSFVDPSADTNKSRWPISKWWAIFLGKAEKVKLTIQQAEKTIEKKIKWIDTQVSTTLAILDIWARRKGENVYDYLIKSLIVKGMQRLKPSHYALLQ